MFNIEFFSSTAFNTEENAVLYRKINDNNMKLFNQTILEMILSKNNFCKLFFDNTIYLR